MMDVNGSCCRQATDRLPNEALVALTVAAVDRGELEAVLEAFRPAPQ